MGGRGVESGTTAVHHLALFFTFSPFSLLPFRNIGPQIGREVREVLRNCTPAPQGYEERRLFFLEISAICNLRSGHLAPIIIGS